jgi:anti-sigma factor RsiW
MPCDDFIDLIVKREEGDLPDGARVTLEEHLATCGDCRESLEDIRRLDAAFASRIREPGLSEKFDQRLLARIQAESNGWSAAELAGRKRQLQEEYAGRLAQMEAQPAGLRRLIDWTGLGGLVAIACWLAWNIVPRLAEFFVRAGLGAGWREVVQPILLGALFLAVGVAASFAGRLRRL